MRIIFSLMLISFSLLGHASVVDKCGEYKFVGEFEQIKDSVVVKLNSTTNSEIVVLLKNSKDFFKKKIKKTYAEGKIKIEKECNFNCEGLLLGVNKVISPLEYEKRKREENLVFFKKCE